MKADWDYVFDLVGCCLMGAWLIAFVVVLALLADGCHHVGFIPC